LDVQRCPAMDISDAEEIIQRLDAMG